MKNILFIFILAAISCNQREVYNCGLNFHNFKIDSCSAGNLQVKTKLDANRRPVLLSFLYSQKLFREDTIIYDHDLVCLLNKKALFDESCPFFIAYSKLDGTTYGVVFYKLHQTYRLCCLIEDESNSQLKVRFANKIGQMNSFSLNKVSSLKTAIKESNFYEGYTYLNYFYEGDTLNCQIKEIESSKSLATPWYKVFSKSKNIYIDQEEQLYDIIKYYSVSEMKNYQIQN